MDVSIASNSSNIKTDISIENSGKTNNEENKN